MKKLFTILIGGLVVGGLFAQPPPEDPCPPDKYEIRLPNPPGPADNNTVAKAYQINAMKDNGRRALINPAGDKDWYKFSNKVKCGMPAVNCRNIRIILTALPPTKDYDMRLYRDGGDLADRKWSYRSIHIAGIPDTIIYNAPVPADPAFPSDSYYVQVYGYRSPVPPIPPDTNFHPTLCYKLIINFKATPWTYPGFPAVFPPAVSGGEERDGAVEEETADGAEWKDLEEEGFMVFPNPANDQLTVVLPPNANVAALELLDATGRVVRSSPQQNNSGETSVEIDVQNLPAGLYLLRADLGNGITTRRVVIER